MVTLSLFHELIHVPNAHMGKLTLESGTWGSFEKSFLSCPPREVKTLVWIIGDGYKSGEEVPDDIKGWM